MVAIAVIFLGQALTWDGTSDLLAPGLASAAVIAALALFLWQAARERHMESEDEPDASAAAERPDPREPRPNGGVAGEATDACRPPVRAAGRGPAPRGCSSGAQQAEGHRRGHDDRGHEGHDPGGVHVTQVHRLQSMRRLRPG